MAGKLLFITSNRLGDAVLSTGLLSAALQRFSPSEVRIACGPLPEPLFRGVPGLEKIFVLDKKRGGWRWFDLWKECVGQKWDVVIDLRNSIVSRFLPAKEIYRFTRSDHTKHKAAQIAAVLKLSSIPASKIWITEEARRKALELMPSGGLTLALCPTANYGPKQWPAERFVEAARKLTAEGAPLAGARIVVFAAGNEAQQVQPLLADLQKTHEVIDLTGKTDPLEAAACLAYCRLCIANDSGLMHLAASMRIPTLGLFGPTNDVEYRPWGPSAAFLRGAAWTHYQSLKDPHELMRAITVDSVVKAAVDLLNMK
jgi:heptosyltransferase III